MFPRRAVCPACACQLFETAHAQWGVVEEHTRLPGDPPLVLASVRCDLGPVVVAAVHGGTVRRGDRIPLTSAEAVTEPCEPHEPAAYLPDT